MSKMNKSTKRAIEISLDSDHFIAGDPLTGEIILNASESNCKLTFIASGTEKATVTNAKSSPKSHRSTIFSASKEITNSTMSLQEVYPFSLKLPSFAPSTFLFDQTISDGHHINAEIIYEIEVVLSKNNIEIEKKTKNFTVFSRKSMDHSENQVEKTMPLSCCVCVPRGSVTLSILNRNSANSIGGEILKFDIILNSSANNQLESFVGQIIFNYSVRIPGESTLTFKKLVSREVSNIEYLKNRISNNGVLNVDFEINFNTEEISGNVCSNEAAIMNSEFILQIFAIYNIGWRSKLIEEQLSFHINPTTTTEQKELNHDWKPQPMPVSIIEAPAENGHLYSTTTSNKY